MIVTKRQDFQQSPQISSCTSPGVVICHFLGQSDKEEDLDSDRLQVGNRVKWLKYCFNGLNAIKSLEFRPFLEM